jgi:uncharacterized membrane protein YraQ (UPF0718 family)
VIYLRLRAARQATRAARWWTQPPRVAHDLLVGYGYRPMLAGAWLLAALLLAFALTGTHQASFEPANLTQACQAAQAARAARGNSPAGSVTPLTTGQSSSWRPTTAWVYYAWTFLKAFGWLLTALLLAGVTGLLRRPHASERKPAGERTRSSSLAGTSPE